MWYHAHWPGVDEVLVTEGPRGQVVTEAGECSVIDKGDRLKVQVHAVVYRHKGEHGCGVGHESPPDAPS